MVSVIIPVYNVEDYFDIDPEFGTLEIFDEFMAETTPTTNDKSNSVLAEQIRAQRAALDAADAASAANNANKEQISQLQSQISQMAATQAESNRQMQQLTEQLQNATAQNNAAQNATASAPASTPDAPSPTTNSDTTSDTSNATQVFKSSQFSDVENIAKKYDIDPDMAVRTMITGEIMTDIENAKDAMTKLKAAMNETFKYAGCNQYGANCSGPHRVKAFKEKAYQYFENNHKDSYRLIVGETEKYKVLREKTSEILSNTNKKVDDESKDDQHSVLKRLIKDSYAKKSYKHSYSSLSHEEETIVDEDETNKEGIIEEGLAMFDKLSKVVNANYDEQHLPITLASDYPRGAKLGTALHEVFETLDFSNHQERLELIINRCFLNQGVIAKDEWIESTKLIVENVIHATLPIVHGSNVTNESLQLKEITLENKKDEVEFNFNLLKGRLKNYCNGFVDLIFKNGDYYSIVDWKSDNLSEDFESYSKVDSLKKHVDDCYSIQRVLYSYCLIKWLKMYMPSLSEQEIFDKHFGGIYYVFLRGCNSNTGNGIYCQTWNNYSDLEKSFNEIINAKVGGNENE